MKPAPRWNSGVVQLYRPSKLRTAEGCCHRKKMSAAHRGEKEQPKREPFYSIRMVPIWMLPRNVAKELGVTFIDMNKITHDLVQGLGPVESKKLFMFVEPNQVPAFPKGREDNTHLNVYGARTIAGLAVDAIGKEIPELAKYIRQFDYVVAQDGSGDFFTVQEAINAVPDFPQSTSVPLS